MATREEILAAADSLVEAGERPTLAAVRKRVGGGSFTTISEAMAEWRASRQEAKPAGEPVPESLGKAGLDWVAVIWAQAQALAGERVQAEREALEAARVEMEQERAEAVELADGLSGELDQRLRQLADLEQALAARDGIIDVLRRELAEARERAARLEGQVETLQETVRGFQARMVPLLGTVNENEKPIARKEKG